ncbi:uncharacterized protein BJ171DRAFT_567503 [Polychytrium aggregatum]|uniref:uncharacterized protein n=1 Tax=Polychytrium aggregatum TaxID=110093 RepID=UPI0022FE62BF|nr:uncharacterized protein BJ171DRAFT_567503 [Polychytrium aggregatum]KAI9205313.1 hypothetical protein BJ171DRAFT_567503 [Polychytrium aggregatum]
MAESSLVYGYLARFDLLTILITNDAFIRAASPPLFAKLLRVSKQTRAILNTDKIWEQLLFHKLQITPEFLFEGVDPSIDRLKVAQGLLCYTQRQNQHRPTNPSMLEKENELWSEVYRDRRLFNRVQRYCQVTDPEFHFPEDARPNRSKQPSVEEMITIAERRNFPFQWPIEMERWPSFTIRPSARRGGNTYVSRLLPFDIPKIDRMWTKELTLEDVSFLEVSGWSRWLSNIQELTIRHRNRDRVAGSLISLEGMPKELPMLAKLDLSECIELKSLKGMPEMPKLETLYLPKSIEFLEGMPKELPMLTWLSMSGCSELKSLKGMPEMPKLEKLLLPKSIESLEDMPNELPMLERLSLKECNQLKSLEEISEMPHLKALVLPKSIESLEGMPNELPRLTWFDPSECSELKSLKGMPEMPKLVTLKLPKSTESLGGLPRELPSLKLLTSP